MQKLLKKSLLIILLIPACNPIKANDWVENPGDHWQGIATVVGIVCSVVPSALMYRMMKKNNVAENLKQEQMLLEKKRQLEEEKNQQDAQRFMYKLSKRYESEFNYLKEHSELSKEVVENGAKQHADQTPFYHIRYGKKLKKSAEKLYSLHGLLSKSKQKKAEKIIGWIKVLREHNSSYFKDEMALQHEEKREAKQQQQLFDLKKAAKEEKIKAKKIKTKAFSEAANAIYSAQNGVELLKNHAHSILNSVQNQLNEGHAVLLQEFNRHGWSSLAQHIKGIGDKFDKGERITSQEIKTLKNAFKLLQDGQETLLAVCTQSNNYGEMKKDIENLKAIVIQLLKKAENSELTFANMTAGIDDIKTIITTPSAPFAGQ